MRYKSEAAFLIALLDKTNKMQEKHMISVRVWNEILFFVDDRLKELGLREHFDVVEQKYSVIDYQDVEETQ